MNTYYESAQGETITRERAIQEVRAHQVDTNEFFSEMGEHDNYDAQLVLEWLGY